MADSPLALLRTLLEIHRRRLDALAPADLHSVIVEGPEPDPPTFASQEDPDADDPDFLPLPPRLWSKQKIESRGLYALSFERNLLYLGDSGAFRDYRSIAADLSRVLSDHCTSILSQQAQAAHPDYFSRAMIDCIWLIFTLNGVGHEWIGHAWSVAVHCLLEWSDPHGLVGRYAWWSGTRRDELPNEPEGDFERFAERHTGGAEEHAGIVFAHVLRNDLVTSSILAIDAIVAGLEGDAALREGDRSEGRVPERAKPHTPCERWILETLRAEGRRMTKEAMMTLGTKADPPHGASTTRNALISLKKAGVLANEPRDPGDKRGHGYGPAEWSRINAS